MRIAHVITRLIVGGAQENTVLCCQSLQDDYDDTALLITGPALGPEGSLFADAHNRRVPIQVIPHLRRAIEPYRDIRAYLAIRRALKAFAPDVVHTHSAKGGILGRQAAWSLKIPAIIHTVHGAPFHDYQSGPARYFSQWCESWAARRCHALVSVADAMTARLVRAGVAPAEKFKTVYSGMELEPFLQAQANRDRARAELGFSPHHFVVGKVARLFHLKGHAYVIDVAARVVRRFSHARFLFVGDGILRAALTARIADAGLSDHFVFTGLVPPQRMPYYLSAMDMVVHTSLREGLARILPQALLSGIPAVSFDIDGAREVILDGQTGRLVGAGDTEGLAAAIEQLAADAPLRVRLAQQGRALCRTRFDYRQMTAQLRDLYRQLLSNR